MVIVEGHSATYRFEFPMVKRGSVDKQNTVVTQRYKTVQDNTVSYLEGGGTLGERDRALLTSADREQWFDDITCSGTDNVELWKSLPFVR